MIRSVLAVLVTVFALTFGATACGAGGSQTDCGVDGCLVRFPRSGDAAVSVLGVQARLDGVQDGVAALEVGGQRVTVPAGGQTEVAGLTVAVEQVTDTEVVVRARF